MSALLRRIQPRHMALAGILALSAFFNTYRLSQNGYANTFYSSGVKSMLVSLHNFLFVSFDPGGLVTIDKPPLALWVQAVSAKLFGFSPLSLLLPEAIISTVAVAVLYKVLAPRLGAAAALIGALVLALFPSLVAVSRDNGVDPLLILLMILACGAALKAIENGRWRTLIWCGVLVGLAFNVKTLAAYLVVPGIAVAYMACAPGTWLGRARKLAVAGVAMGVVSFAWIAMVELVPASQRPFVGSSTNNTELGLTFEYNGFGRVEGEVGGPGQIPTAAGGVFEGPKPPGGAGPRRGGGSASPVARSRPGGPSQPGSPSPPAAPAKPGRVPSVLPNGRERNAIAFGGATGPLRLFDHQLSDQGSWLLPFALFGVLALALAIYLGEGEGDSEGDSEGEGGGAGPLLRRWLGDRRTGVLIVLGGWLLVEFVLLSFSKGIVHPYYISALAPGVAAMSGAGAVSLAKLVGERDWRASVLLVVALAATLAAQLSIMGLQHYMHWFVPVLIAGVAIVGVGALVARGLTAPAMAVLLCLILIVPSAYAATTWTAPVDGTFAAAGPHQAASEGKYGVNAELAHLYRNLAAYVDTHRPGSRWSVLMDASTTAAPLILFGSKAGALGGYSGSDPVLDGPSLGRLVARGEVRYVVIGGPYASRGGNLATKAVLRACKPVPYRAWHGEPPSIHTLVLFDCAGDGAALARGDRG